MLFLFRLQAAAVDKKIVEGKPLPDEQTSEWTHMPNPKETMCTALVKVSRAHAVFYLYMFMLRIESCKCSQDSFN